MPRTMSNVVKIVTLESLGVQVGMRAMAVVFPWRRNKKPGGCFVVNTWRRDLKRFSA